MSDTTPKDEHGISFITCARRGENATKLRESIAVTIGDRISYELVAIDNSQSQFDIFSAYTKGAREAKLSILGFVHDDVQLLSNRLWIDGFIDLMNLPSTGAVGVAGSKQLTSTGKWWDRGNKLSGAVIHTKDGEEWMSAFGPYGEVAVLDGLLFFMRRDVFTELGGFERSELSGWHFYDIDLVARAHWAGYRNYTIDLVVKHQSTGAFGQDWDENRRTWLAANLNRLPIKIT